MRAGHGDTHSGHDEAVRGRLESAAAKAEAQASGSGARNERRESLDGRRHAATIAGGCGIRQIRRLTQSSLRRKVVCMSEDDDQQQDPREMLALMDTARRAAVRKLSHRYIGLFVVWAVAWAIGFGTLYVTIDVGAIDLVPTPVGWIVFATLIIAAIAWSTIVGISAAGDGIRGPSQQQGMLYGLSWTITMFMAWLLIAGLQRNGLAGDVLQLVYPGVYVFLVGVLYLSGGALFRGVPMYVLGGILIAVAVVATFFGSPTHYLVYATVGPAAMLIVAALMAWGPLRTRAGS